ncbi:MAG: hypothetical protein LLF86_00360 [Nitrospiraceae bacterium]|nr:hypothetical protein [Nitrospiraceae bacterium]
MDPRVIPFVKEEIIRNVIKSHASLLVTGWQKSGKSVSAVKAAMSVADTYYFDPLGNVPVEDIKERSASSDMQAFVAAIKLSDEVFSVLVVDNYEKLAPVDMLFLKSMLKDKKPDLKLILISGAFASISAMMDGIEAVVRVKVDTAELVYSSRMNS